MSANDPWESLREAKRGSAMGSKADPLFDLLKLFACRVPGYQVSVIS